MQVHLCSVDAVLASTTIADPEPTFAEGLPALVFHSVSLRGRTTGVALFVVLTLRDRPWAMVPIEQVKVRRRRTIILTDLVVTLKQTLDDVPPAFMDRLVAANTPELESPS